MFAEVHVDGSVKVKFLIELDLAGWSIVAFGRGLLIVVIGEQFSSGEGSTEAKLSTVDAEWSRPDAMKQWVSQLVLYSREGLVTNRVAGVRRKRGAISVCTLGLFGCSRSRRDSEVLYDGREHGRGVSPPEGGEALRVAADVVPLITVEQLVRVA